MTRIKTALGSIFLAALFASAAVAAAPVEHHLYGCRLTGQGPDGPEDLLTFPMHAPSPDHMDVTKETQSNRKTTLNLSLSWEGKIAIRFTDDIYRKKLYAFQGKIEGVNPEAAAFGKIEKTFAVKEKHSFPFTSYTISCE